MGMPLVGVRGLAPLVLPALLAGARAPAAEDRTPRPVELALELDAPLPDARIRLEVPLAMVSGRAGRAPLFASDVVIAIDQSRSTLLASGLDVDRDGVLGRSRLWAADRGRFAKPRRSWTTDPDDTVLAAEISAAASLVHGLAARRNRIGVLTFAAQPRIRTGVGAPEAGRAALDRIQRMEHEGGTDVARALGVAAQMFDAAPAVEGPRPPRAVLLLSDGRPTLPDGDYWASRRGVETARELAEAGIEIWTLALGARPDAEYLEEMARLTGGDRLRLEDLPALANEPALVSLEPRELAIENLTLARGGRAVRIFSDGRFDGLVPLAPGENTLEVRAVLADGRRQSLRRVVHYEQAPPEERRDTAALLLKLRQRTREIDGPE